MEELVLESFVVFIPAHFTKARATASKSMASMREEELDLSPPDIGKEYCEEYEERQW
jgi:hypothetical protein